MRIRQLHAPRLLLALLLAGVSTSGIAAQDPPEAAASRVQQVVTGDRTIGQGEVVDEIIVVGGDLRIRGHVRGDALVVGGDLFLEGSAVVDGDAVVTGGELINEGGRVRGEMRTVTGRGIDIGGEVRRALGGAHPEGEADEDQVVRPQIDAAESRGWFTSVRRGLAGVVSTVALGLVLGGIGALLVFYGRPYLETVSDTVRGAGLRSAATGFAASFLIIPAFLVMLVALAVSIVGIPLLLIAIPAYPVLIFGTAVYGLLAVAHAVGERTAEQSGDPFSLRNRNSYAYLFTGLGLVLVPLVAAHLLQMTGFLGFIVTLLMVLTFIVIWVATTVGFGAVILSRAGTRRTFAPAPPEPAVDTDDLFGDAAGTPDDV